MGINDPLIVEYREKRKSFILLRGNETFYDFDNYLIEFETLQEAVDFAINEIGELPTIEKLPPEKGGKTKQLEFKL